MMFQYKAYIVAIVADLFFVVSHKLARLNFFVVVFRHDLAVTIAAVVVAYACIVAASKLKCEIYILLCICTWYSSAADWCESTSLWEVSQQ
jgi:hypothetical protein